MKTAGGIYEWGLAMHAAPVRPTLHMGGPRLARVICLLLAGLIAFSSQGLAPAAAADAAPWIQSDKDDYPPGALVQLTGGDWQPGESVHVYVNDDQGRTWERNADVVADDSGAVTDSFNLPDWFVATYKVVATGELSGSATTGFTDGNIEWRTDPAGAATITATQYDDVKCLGKTRAPVTGASGSQGVGNGSILFQAPASSGRPVLPHLGRDLEQRLAEARRRHLRVRGSPPRDPRSRFAALRDVRHRDHPLPRRTCPASTAAPRPSPPR